MQWQNYVMWGVVFVFGVSASWQARWYNRTAFALTAAWALSDWWAFRTGVNMPFAMYRLTDMVVMTAILCKPPHFPPMSWVQKLPAILASRTLSDQIILAIYVAAWVTYDAPISEWSRYWILWGLAIAQFIAAGCEAAHAFYATRGGTSARNGQPLGMLRLAWGRYE